MVVERRDRETELRERLVRLNDLRRAEQESGQPSKRYIEDLTMSIASIEAELKPKGRHGGKR